MARHRRLPRVGELWRTTGSVPLGFGRVIPAGTPVMVIEQRRNSMNDLEFQVIWGESAGWISEHCSLWESLDEAR